MDPIAVVLANLSAVLDDIALPVLFNLLLDNASRAASTVVCVSIDFDSV